MAAAVTAKQVLGGLAPPPPAMPAVPERARRRAADVVGELAQPSTRALVQRLAAEAILAVAAPDDPLCGKARAVLASTPADGK